MTAMKERQAAADLRWEKTMKRARLPHDHPKYLPYTKAAALAMRRFTFEMEKEDEQQGWEVNPESE